MEAFRFEAMPKGTTGSSDMFRKAQSLGCILVLSTIAILATPDFSQAQRGGGGRGGGGHFGGARVGGARVGGARIGGNRGGVHVGGYHPGGYHPGAFRGDVPLGGYRYGYGQFLGGYYGTGGYYGSPSLEGVPTYDPGDLSSYGVAPLDLGDATYGTPPEAYQSLYPPPVTPPAMTTPLDTNAQVTVNVPADAEVWFDGTEMTPTGAVRRFHSPPLAPGNYRYQIRAQWHENGHEVSQTQTVEFAPGAHIAVSFPVTPAAVPTQAK